MLEKVWYELSPVIYIVVSCVVMFNGNLFAIFFAALLLSVSLLIGVMRIQSRSTPRVTKARQSKRPYDG
ncbi:hypothetical protein [Crenothrix sp.]|uniref:hypothetical protein n=1 Tax=Crenothrix sp. TaxID=3100433 RepID=UPI00374DC0A4